VPIERVLSRPGGRTEPARQTTKILGIRWGLAARGRAFSGTKEGNMARLVRGGNSEDRHT
jgi:hypothetical protein